MSNYIENPKTKGSGIIACIPQEDLCPRGCEDCFFQSGRSYLEPLEENLPNMPSVERVGHRVVRVNDGNDSNHDQKMVIESTKQYQLKYYNTSIPYNLEEFNAPVVLTVNPANITDENPNLLIEIPENLMFVRVRVNAWNVRDVVDPVVEWYTRAEVPIVLTFMAYFMTEIPRRYKSSYIFRKRTLNSYNAITTRSWRRIMSRYENNWWVYSCGKIEGELGTSKCSRCGNCLREFFNTMERMKG